MKHDFTKDARLIRIPQFQNDHSNPTATLIPHRKFGGSGKPSMANQRTRGSVCEDGGRGKLELEQVSKRQKDRQKSSNISFDKHSISK